MRTLTRNPERNCSITTFTANREKVLQAMRLNPHIQGFSICILLTGIPNVKLVATAEALPCFNLASGHPLCYLRFLSL